MQHVILGRLGKSYGLKGEVRCHPETDFPERIARLESVDLLDSKMRRRSIRIEHVLEHTDHLLIKFAGIETAEDAATLSGLWLGVPRDQLPAPPENHYYWIDLDDCALQLPDGRTVGRVEDILRMPTCDLLVTTIEDGEILLPFIDDVVREVRLKDRVIVVTPLPGMVPDHYVWPEDSNAD
ncbi:16S rRNA processing protein RimM [bacterium]|nr:16S rRNA processing protein RimM [candidate division CSSED10-310 bacterium]